MDLHNRRPPGSGSALTDADPDPGGDKLRNKSCTANLQSPSKLRNKIAASYKSENKI